MNQSFRDTVYQITRSIPLGKVATYGQVAALAGNPRAARAVGVSLKNNPNIPTTPCHRVVASDGSLAGYAAGEGIKTKLALLIDEGVKFTKNNKVNLSKSLWCVK